MSQPARTINEYIKAKAISLLGLIDSNIDPNAKAERLTFVNDISEIRKLRLQEYNIWYVGDSDELLNFYTRAQNIDYNYDPLYNRNKKEYYWSVASTESNVKRTHSSIPKAIVDTLVNVIGVPNLSCTNRTTNDVLQKILEANRFNHLLVQKSRPSTFVEGYGAFKINWDTALCDTPILLYYNANNVDFFYKSNVLCAIVYKDYYTDKNKKNYILFETRRKGIVNGKKGLIIEKELFLETPGSMLVPMKLTDLPELKDVKDKLFVSDYDGLLGCPSIYFEDSQNESYGRSIFQGKTDLFDDADQCLSQAANSVRKSTPLENLNSLFLERDQRTGTPIMPKCFDRHYIMYRGVTNADGGSNVTQPTTITQPDINFQQYDMELTNIFNTIVSGLMSVATFGFNISNDESAVSQREKNKITIYTRNTVIEEETYMLKTICKELLCAQQLMLDGEIKKKDFNIDVKYNGFAETSREHRLEVLGNAFNAGIISPKMLIDELYGNDVSEESKQEELEYIEGKEQQAQQQMMQMQQQQMMSPEQLGEIGAELGGMNSYDYAKSKTPEAGSSIPDEDKDKIPTELIPPKLD